MAEERNGITDPRALRAIAHPVRLRILDELDARGAMRAADIAQALDIPANQASFHLRQLAKYSFVVEAPEAARDGRDRVWRAQADDVRFEGRALRDVPGARAALKVVKQYWAERVRAMIDRTLWADGQEGEVYSDNLSSLRLTHEQARELIDELGEVIKQWTERGQAATEADARTYDLAFLLQPAPPVGRLAEDD